MSTARSTGPMKWYGWGDPERRLELGAGAVTALRSEVGEGKRGERASLEAVVIPPPHPLPESLAQTVGPAAVCGVRAVWSVPAGAVRRREVTSSSKRP